LRVDLLLGDCREVMAGMAECSVDAIVTDPPYGLEFMGKDWDDGVPGIHFWQEAIRVAKPGAHLLAFGGTRTFHRLVCAIEDAGWEIRDTVMWVYGSGFPKSHDVGKAIDREAGADREVVGENPNNRPNCIGKQTRSMAAPITVQPITAPATDAAKQWDGWGTALKPAWEPVIVARKPLQGTVAANVQRWGTGAINVDGCRVGTRTENESGWSKTGSKASENRSMSGANYARDAKDEVGTGRWPANLIHDGSEEVLAGFPDRDGATSNSATGKSIWGSGGKGVELRDGYADSGSASRFFYCAKASKADRDEGNGHPTVKPTALMRYLCRLVTPPGGVVLDPFMGSGSTGKAALAEGFDFIGIEMNAEYMEIARARVRVEQPEMVYAADA